MHLVIGAPQSAASREYAIAWERATQQSPRVLSWEPLCAPSPGMGELAWLTDAGPEPLLLRLCAPAASEYEALTRSAQQPEAQELSPEPSHAAFTGLCRALVQLTSLLASHPAPPRYTVPPAAVQLFLDQERRRQAMAEDNAPCLPLWPQSGGTALRYQALRERLRRGHGARVRVRPAQGLQPTPLLYLWGGAVMRARSDLSWTARGVARHSTVRDLDEGQLRPLLLALLAQGALIEEEWEAEEIAGQRGHLQLLVTPQRVVLGAVTSADPFAHGPSAGAPDFATVRRQVPAALWDRMEATLCAVVRRQRCAALLFEVALAPRRGEFMVMDVDPLASLPGGLRDAVGWSASDHLVRALRDSAQEDAATPAGAGDR